MTSRSAMSTLRLNFPDTLSDRVRWRGWKGNQDTIEFTEEEFLREVLGPLAEGGVHDARRR